MKKILRSLLYLAITFTVASCGGSKGNEDSSLTPLQNQAVAYVRTHLERGDKLIDYKVVEEPIPAAIMEQPFLNIRNTVYKAGLDYQSCKTRGLQKGMEMAEEKLEEAKTQTLQTVDFLNQNIGSNKSVIVLATVQARKSVDGEPNSLIVVFDPSTMEAKEWIPVTKPVQNTVALVICAEDDTLAEYAKEQNRDTKVLVSKTDNPVLKFVLDARAM
ncbi:MAG: hypothetical protein J1F38_02665 [Muribaculaceae bacterium]|nr:hypothetical protein [Muribaculaceae bacterium]